MRGNFKHKCKLCYTLLLLSGLLTAVNPQLKSLQDVVAQENFDIDEIDPMYGIQPKLGIG
jgi:hypothetical protein